MLAGKDLDAFIDKFWGFQAERGEEILSGANPRIDARAEVPRTEVPTEKLIRDDQATISQMGEPPAASIRDVQAAVPQAETPLATPIRNGQVAVPQTETPTEMPIRDVRSALSQSNISADLTNTAAALPKGSASLSAVPFLLFAFATRFHGRNYLWFSLLILLAAMLPFFLKFEGRKPKARELVVIAALSAIGVAGRAVFYMFPHVKPIAAVVILTGISLGGEAGFLTGSLIMLISNLFAGQGPWTPWQMFSYGLIGLLSGSLFQRGILRATLPQICAYGFFSVLLVFGGIMNPAGILMGYGEVTAEALLAAYVSGLPLDLVQAAATAAFLCVFSRPMLEKLERVKQKYGLLEIQ